MSPVEDPEAGEVAVVAAGKGNVEVVDFVIVESHPQKPVVARRGVDGDAGVGVAVLEFDGVGEGVVGGDGTELQKPGVAVGKRKFAAGAVVVPEEHVLVVAELDVKGHLQIVAGESAFHALYHGVRSAVFPGKLDVHGLGAVLASANDRDRRHVVGLVAGVNG